MIPTTQIGSLTVGCQGFGAMGISEFYGLFVFEGVVGGVY